MHIALWFLVLAALAVAGLFIIARERRSARRSGLIGACNTLPDEQVGTHGAEGITRLTDAALASKYLLVRKGSDGNHVALGNASTAPLGVVYDEAAAAEESVAVQLLGATTETRKLRAAKAIAVGANLYAAANGLVTDEPPAGTAFFVGRALTAADALNDVLEAETCLAIAVTIES